MKGGPPPSPSGRSESRYSCTEGERGWRNNNKYNGRRRYYMRNSLINKIKRWSAVGIVMAIAAGIYSPMASAHGEKSQPAFMRMRTIQWYDLQWSTDKVKVNEEMTVTGKL